MSRVTLGLVFLLSFCAGLVAMAPLQFFAERAVLGPVSYSRAEGTIWRGRLNDVAVAGETVGDIDLTAKPLALLSGRVRYAAEFRGPAGVGRGDIEVSFGGAASISNAVADISLQDVRQLDPRLRTSPSKLSVTVNRVELDSRRQCRTAAGRVQTDILAAAGEPWGWRGPSLSGDLNCDDGALALTMANETGADDIAIRGQIEGNGGFTAGARVITGDNRLARALETLGFVYTDGIYDYNVTNMTPAG